MNNYVFIGLLLLFFGTARLIADEAPNLKEAKRTVASSTSYRDKKGLSLLAFQMGGGFITDLQDHVRGAAMVAWTPTYHFNSTVSTRWSIGLNYRNAFKSDELRVGEFTLTLIEKPKFNSPLFGELGGGVQYWTGDSTRKFYPEVKVGFGYQFGDGEGFLKSFQLAYNYVFQSPLKTPQLLGVLTIGF